MTTIEKLGYTQYHINVAKKNSKRTIYNNKHFKRGLISLRIRDYFASK